MEALAARQLLRQKNVPTDNNLEPVLEKDKDVILLERLALNKLLGFPDPPAQVFAIGKDECAAVWWKVEEDETITDWEVHRFRKDKSRPELDIWHYKGFITFPNSLKTQTVVNNLTNDYEYRFTVKAVSSKGSGSESPPSNSVMVEKPLPTGWYRFIDKTSKRPYYANVRLNTSTWNRPEQDPWFLDEAILHNFNNREIEALKALYKEEIAHFKCVSVDQFMDVLREIGERCTKSWIIQLFQGYGSSSRALYSWKHFMEVINHIKKYRTGGIAVVKNPLELLINFFNRKRIGVILQPKADKLGDWVVEYSSLAERDYYYNSKTGESYWSMPPQVKFYIPPKLEDKLLLVFDYGDIEEFQQYFSLLDIDSSGDLSPKEIRILLRALDIQISELKFNKLIRTVDLNGNGKIEFDEYCWMMLQLYRKDNSEFWKEMRSRHKATKPPVNDFGADGDNSWSGGALGLPAGSLDNSLFDDKAWGKKLSYDRMRNVLNTMKQFTGQGRRNSRKPRFSLSSAVGGSRRGGSLLGLSRQSSVNLSGDDCAPPGLSATSAGSVLWCCFYTRKRNHNSDLNFTLSKYNDEDMGEKPGSYYPPATIKLEHHNMENNESGRPTGSVAGTTGGSNAGAPQFATARAGRRVSFTSGGPVSDNNKNNKRKISSGGLNSPSSTSSLRKNSSIGTVGVNASVSVISDEGDQTFEKSRRRSSGSINSKNSKVLKVRSEGRRRSSATAAAKVEESDVEDEENSEEGNDDDNKSVVSFTSAASFMKRMGSFTRLLSGGGDNEVDNNSLVHPKYCMCGCRAY